MSTQIEQIRAQLNRLIRGPAQEPFQVGNLSAGLASLIKSVEQQDQADAHAQFILGRCYYNGDGVTQDYKEAVEWYTKAAKQGNAEARHQMPVSQMYF